MRATVYRVHDAEGRGPWRPGFSRTWVEDRPDHANLKPWPMEFGTAFMRRIRPTDHCGVGCLTIEGLRRWFTPSEWATLRLHGYRAVIIHGARVLAHSDIQAVFTIDHPLDMAGTGFDLYARTPCK